MRVRRPPLAADLRVEHVTDPSPRKLGRATTPTPMTARRNGAYRRDFEGGIALVNPKGASRCSRATEQEAVLKIASRAAIPRIKCI